MPPIWVGFWPKNSPNKGPFFGRFSINMGGLYRNWQKLSKMGSFPPELIIMVGLTAAVGN